MNTNFLPINRGDLASFDDHRAHFISCDKHDVTQRIYQSVKPVLAELILALSLNLGSMAIFAVPFSIPLMTVILSGTLVFSCLFPFRDISQMRKVHIISRLSIANHIGLSGLNYAVHEIGHLLAAKILFKNSNAWLWIKPFQGGSTSYTVSNGLTFIGGIFCKHSAKMVIAGAGFAASTIFMMMELRLAHRLKKVHLVMAHYLKLHVVCHLVNEVSYGLTAFVAAKQDLCHDLVYLWQLGGIHPLIPLALMTSLVFLANK